MPYKKLSGMQRLRKAQADRAERKRRKIASEKKGKDELTPHLTPLPSRPKLRTATPAQRRRISKPKGGQRLADIAKKGRKARESRVGGKTYVTPTRRKPTAPTPTKKPTAAKKPTAKKPAAKKPRAGVAPRTTRTPTRRAADKKMWQAMQKEARKESAGMRYGSEYKGPPKMSKKDQDAWARSMELGSGGGLIKAGVGAGLTALGLKAHKWHKAKKAADLASGKTGGQMAGIGSARSGSAASRTSGLGKPKTPKKTKSALSSLLKFFKRKPKTPKKTPKRKPKTPKSAFTKTPKKKTQRRYPK